jgi:hypothetical protein
MSDWVRVKRIMSKNGRQWIDIEARDAGQSRFVETTIILMDGEDLPTLTHFSGLYPDAQIAELDAKQMLPWLKTENSN